MTTNLQRRLIVNADDFGRSASINEAVIRAHREGILTTTSLMVNEEGCPEAVRLAQENPKLGVGLHLTLICGRAALAPAEIPGLVDAQGRFNSNPVSTGYRYFARKDLHAQLEAEIAAQFRKFQATGLKLDHVNGHLHLHLHPTVFKILMDHAREWQIQHMRLSYDPFWLNVSLAKGRWLYRLAHALVFGRLCPRSRRVLDQRGIKYAPVVFGMLQDSHVDESFVLKLLPRLPTGDSELYCHPSLGQFKHEFDALVSANVRALVSELNLQLIRYQDL